MPEESHALEKTRKEIGPEIDWDAQCYQNQNKLTKPIEEKIRAKRLPHQELMMGQILAQL